MENDDKKYADQIINTNNQILKSQFERPTTVAINKHAEHAYNYPLPLQDTQEMCLLELQEVCSSKPSYPM